MTLQTLRTRLQTLTGTNIGEVFFDWKDYLNETRNKTYPCVLWQLDGAKFVKDDRTATIQKTKILTLTVFAISLHDPNIDKMVEWDTLEGYFDVYLNKVNEMTGLTIENINEIKGQYAGEGLISADREVGIMYTEVQLKTWC
jgi:hypothetical protein